MKFKSYLLLAIFAVSSAFAAVGCSSDNAEQGDVNSDVEINSPDNPKSKGLRRGTEAG